MSGWLWRQWTNLSFDVDEMERAAGLCVIRSKRSDCAHPEYYLGAAAALRTFLEFERGDCRDFVAYLGEREP